MQQNKEGDKRASEPGSKGAQVGGLHAGAAHACRDVGLLAQPKGGWRAVEPGSKVNLGIQAQLVLACPTVGWPPKSGWEEEQLVGHAHSTTFACLPPSNCRV